jgi:chromosome segregation ATPase
LAEHVQSCLEEAEQGSELLGDIETAARRLRGPASSTSAAIEEFGEATAEHELDIDLEDAKQRLTATIEFLQDPSTSHETYESDVESIPDELAIKEEREALRGLIPDEDEEEGEEAEETSSLGHWKTLSKVDDRLQGLREAQKEARTKNLVETKASHLYEAYIEARDDELDDLYADLSERFSELYEAVHGPDEGDFEATLDPEGAGVYMEVPFYGRGSYPPNALHSEGHQDSMGLCLFFALREHLPGQTIPLVLLDDVVMSIDAGHRRDVARLLRQEFDDLQLLITTHDKNWARQLRDRRCCQPVEPA